MASVRDAILDAAADLLDHSGPDGVTLRGVGERAGVSHNAPYKHFRDKEALLAAVAVREFAVRRGMMAGIVEQAASPLGALRALARDHIAWAMANPYRFHLLFGGWTRHDDALDEAAGTTRLAFVDILRGVRVQVAGWPEDDERTAALLMATAHGAIDLALGGHLAADGKGGADPTDLVDDLIDLLSGARSAPA
ncbi:MAG TPA: TetR/AcrR family transcriptional regulator [Sphingomonas sp.]|uniref:TetR/AcrR family transcriptional regulator n=1 Tax=Sphingomonas sp. TaxID=28214 RepID=UPI002BC95329|nr:TetR/AcrR family transcriptional regulator [Sphingomonas sp.]HMI20157.1 TetR/AcrR family transcriptional regulator [Sphingomonas sp.]